MKENKCCLLLILLLFVAFNALSQKKKTFWDSVKDVANASGISGRVIKGDWGELGAGAYEQYGPGGYNLLFSPRNHKYAFAITRDNSEVKLQFSTTVQYTYMIIVSEYGESIGAYSNSAYGHTVKFPRAGKYYVYVNGERYSKGKYRIEMNGAVSNIERVSPSLWEQNNLSFGAEGSGSISSYSSQSSTIYSPRNHLFFFEPEIGSYYDINVASNTGTNMAFVVVEPGGKIIRSSGNSPGLKYIINKATLSGKYAVYIGALKTGEQGSYQLQIMGNLKDNPQRIESNFKKYSLEFKNPNEEQRFSIPVKSLTGLDVLYRSSEATANFSVTDSYNKVLSPKWIDSPSFHYVNVIYNPESSGKHTLSLQSKTAGKYELLIWGDFDEVEHIQGSSGSNTQNQNSGNLIKTSGEIRSAKASVDYSSVKVQAHDYDTGEKKNEVSPDKSGKYILELEPGKKYSITVLSDGKYLASTENVDLTSAKIGETKIATPIQLLGGDDIGKKLTLNNIFFDTGSPILLRQSYAELKRAATFLKANPHLKIEVAGHTDSVGDDASNLSLSQNRANAVLYYLQDQLDDFSRLSAKGYGKNDPVANNSSEEGRKQNRRVELRIK